MKNTTKIKQTIHKNSSEVYLSQNIENILSKLDFSRLKGTVGIKVHFGEKGCTTYMDPAIVKKVYDKIVSLGHKAKLIESNVLYRGSRTNATDHIKTAHSHGFTFAEIDILDGEEGDEFIEVELSSGVATKTKIGTGLKRYDSLVIISHFKGHSFAGYGGVFKNAGMGMGSRAGKLHMHADVNPSILDDKCTACGVCFKGCDFGAITLSPKASIDDSKCTGCAMCIALCKYGAVNIPWGTTTNENLQKKIVDYTEGVFKIIPISNCIFINIANKITKECDCMGISQKPMMADLGIFAGYDPVAIDKACIDLAGEKFKEVNSWDKLIQIRYAEEKGLGKQEYNLVRL